MDTKNYFGFEFVKIGVAKLTVESIDVVFVGDELKYAGQYSGTFEERVQDIWTQISQA